MFSKLVKDVNNNKIQDPINFTLDGKILNRNYYMDKLKNINDLTDKELFDLIIKSYDDLLKDIFTNDNTQFLLLFINSRFLSVLIQALNSNKIEITPYIRMYCNKLAYDYLTLGNDDDAYLKQLFLSLSKTVNRQYIPLLQSLGIPEELAAKMALSRFSSDKEIVNVKRLNFVIMQSPIQLMTEQMIVFIYEKLFDELTPLLKGIMFDVLSDIDYDTMSEDMIEIYSTISLAILDMLNNMTSANMRKVLLSYEGDYSTLIKSTKGVRFSFRTLSEDFRRISDVVEALSNNEKIYVP